MRKLIVLAAVVALVLVAAPAAFAGNGRGGSKASVVTYSLRGDVTDVDAVKGVVSLTVVKANRAARGHKGEVVHLQVASTTRLYERTADGERVAVTLAAVATGDRVTSTGRLNRSTDVFRAKRLTIALPVETCLTD